MNYLSFKKYIKNPYKIFSLLGSKGKLKFIPDKTYLKLVYKGRTGRRLNLDNPISFNEKIQWLKLNDRKITYSKLVDKFEVRNFVAQKIGEKYLIPILGIYKNFEEINFDELPNQFVLKCTHDSGGVVICTDKKNFDFKTAELKINKHLSNNYFSAGREFPYKHIVPQIICEKYMVDESKQELKDYKFFCFDGKPALVQVDFNRFIDHKRNLYDANWNFIDASIEFSNDPNIKIMKPYKLKEMLNLAETLSKGFKHVRIDFYYIEGQIFFGEVTFYHGSGFEKFSPESFGDYLGGLIKI